MKIVIIGMFLVLGFVAFISKGFLDFISDISSILFFGFATLSMISISAIIAIDTAKVLKFRILDNEYKNLKDDLHEHITRNVYRIDFSDEANIKHEEFKSLDQKITNIKGANYETK